MPDCLGDVVDHMQCSTCGEWLPLNSQFFSVHKMTASGYDTSKCKDCRYTYWRQHNSGENKKRWFKKRANKAKDRSTKKGLPFLLKYSDIEYPTHCAVTGLELTYSLCAEEDGKRRPNAASIDRIDSSLGYVPGNVRVISWIGNWMKGDLSESDFLDVIKLIYDNNFREDQLECKCRTVA